MAEQAIVSLDALGTDWASLVRFVQRSGQPLWIEADGEIHGVLLPTDQARRLLGYYAMQHSREAAQVTDNQPDQPTDANDERVASTKQTGQPVKKTL